MNQSGQRNDNARRKGKTQNKGNRRNIKQGRQMIKQEKQEMERIDKRRGGMKSKIKQENTNKPKKEAMKKMKQRRYEQYIFREM